MLLIKHLFLVKVQHVFGSSSSYPVGSMTSVNYEVEVMKCTFLFECDAASVTQVAGLFQVFQCATYLRYLHQSEFPLSFQASF